ncbi:hypothetical protein [Clostridium gasigenes]|uniref:Uncharacterized protein n=1 Tax=Clostridium gasigenes TaxID=94869 RepID=A0A1H0ND80_9CLOT|nr:hypothetical protein [Clostridium gasigenes]SDO90270.1 hypothetical protein SAMN04488529_101779 [Clostridium gasigenes]
MINEIKKFYENNMMLSRIGIGSFVLDILYIWYRGGGELFEFIYHLSLAYLVFLISYIVKVYLVDEKKKSMKKVIADLRFWIGVIILFIICGNISIYLSPFDYKEKFPNYVSLNGSLLGGLITLVSIFITNQYYNKEKILQDKSNKTKKNDFKIKALKLLKYEFELNKENCEKVKAHGGKDVFQTVVWKEFRGLFVEIFTEISTDKTRSNIFSVQKFYILADTLDGLMLPYHGAFDYIFESFDNINKIIDAAISYYENIY